MVIAMADKLWIGTQTEFTNLGTYQIDDIFSTKSTSSYNFNYHDTCSMATLASWNLDTFITITPEGKCVANSGALVAADPIPVTNKVLHKFYRGKGGTIYREYVRSANKWVKLGDVYRDSSLSQDDEGSETGLTNYIVVDSLPSSGIKTNKVYLVKYDITNSVESLFGSKTVDGVTSSKSLADITTEVRNKYFY
jgi:hypothetical protein